MLVTKKIINKQLSKQWKVVKCVGSNSLITTIDYETNNITKQNLKQIVKCFFGELDLLLAQHIVDVHNASLTK